MLSPLAFTTIAGEHHHSLVSHPPCHLEVAYDNRGQWQDIRAIQLHTMSPQMRQTVTNSNSKQHKVYVPQSQYSTKSESKSGVLPSLHVTASALSRRERPVDPDATLGRTYPNDVRQWWMDDVWRGYGLCWLLPAVNAWLASLHLVCSHMCWWTSTAEAFHYEPFMENIRIWQLTKHHWVALTKHRETETALSIVCLASFANTCALKFANTFKWWGSTTVAISNTLKGHAWCRWLCCRLWLWQLTNCSLTLCLQHMKIDKSTSLKGIANGKYQSRMKNSIQQ